MRSASPRSRSGRRSRRACRGRSRATASRWHWRSSPATSAARLLPLGVGTSGVSADSKLRDLIVATGGSLFERGLTHGSTGNISVRLDDGGWLMTPTGSSLGTLDPTRLSRLDRHGRADCRRRADQGSLPAHDDVRAAAARRRRCTSAFDAFGCGELHSWRRPRRLPAADHRLLCDARRHAADGAVLSAGRRGIGRCGRQARRPSPRGAARQPRPGGRRLAPCPPRPTPSRSSRRRRSCSCMLRNERLRPLTAGQVADIRKRFPN